MRITLDTNILVRAAGSPGGPAMRLLEIVILTRSLVLSDFIVEELRRVLRYPRIQSRYGIAASEAGRFVGRIGAAAYLVEPSGIRPPVSPDPNDDPILYTAADGKADILCTLNIRHFTGPAARDFCAQHGIRVMTDVEALRELGS